VRGGSKEALLFEKRKQELWRIGPRRERGLTPSGAKVFWFSLAKKNGFLALMHQRRSRKLNTDMRAKRFFSTRLQR
jgi:hypothetical protein